MNLKNKNSTTRETKEVFFIQNAFINIFDSDLAVTERCGLTRWLTGVESVAGMAQSARPMQRGRSSTGSWTGRHAQSLVALVYFI